MTWVFIQAKDVLLFRDGKPFSSGEDHSASSIFPPTPLTVQGAMRAKISTDLGVSLHEYRNGNGNAKQAYDYIGEPGTNVQTGRFTMQGPFVGICVDGVVHQLVPVPMDLFKFDCKFVKPEDVPNNLKDCIKPGKKPSYRIARLDKRIVTDLNKDYLHLETIEAYESIGNHWMTADAFNNYLDENAPPDNPDDCESRGVRADCDDAGKQESRLSLSYHAGQRVFSNQALYQTEGRFGVATNAQTSFRRDGQLYQAQFIRMSSEVGLLVNVDNIPDDDLLFGALILGGEQKQAIAQKVDKISTIKANPETITGQFKVIILTPAYFDGGWKPEDNFAELFNADVKLVGAALDRPQRIGGWSSNGKGGARPMHNYVAPGTVYYFDAGDSTITLPTAFTQTPDSIDDAGKIGFGQFASGSWSL